MLWFAPSNKCCENYLDNFALICYNVLANKEMAIHQEGGNSDHNAKHKEFAQWLYQRAMAIGF